MAERFEAFWRRLECSNDDWIRTTEPRHREAVTELLRRIQQRNPDDLYVADYEGLYCTGCEEFKQPAQIVNGHCIEHPSLELVPTKERNHFFRLSRYRDAVLDRIRSGEFRVEPAIRRNEVVRLLQDGLQDISVSRHRSTWGIPFPGDPEQTVYVWFDALINYLSATGFPAPGYERRWPADLHVIGKGITRFHCIIWPAMLLAAGEALPRMVWAHGYVQWEGTKMSKTAGTAVTLDEAIERHGPDALRYFLLREVGFENDGNFSWERFDERYTADLADGLGNLASRALAMLGQVPRRRHSPRHRADDPRLGRCGGGSAICRGDGWSGPARRSRGGVGARGHGESLHPADRALEPGQGGPRCRAGRRTRGAWSRALSARGASGSISPREGVQSLAVAGSRGRTGRQRVECAAVACRRRG